MGTGWLRARWVVMEFPAASGCGISPEPSAYGFELDTPTYAKEYAYAYAYALEATVNPVYRWAVDIGNGAVEAGAKEALFSRSHAGTNCTNDFHEHNSYSITSFVTLTFAQWEIDGLRD